MADFTSKFAYRYRKGIAATSVGVRTSATEADADTPTVTSGTGVPAATTEPNGSIFLRTDASGAAAALYMRIGGSWVAIDGS